MENILLRSFLRAMSILNGPDLCFKKKGYKYRQQNMGNYENCEIFFLVVRKKLCRLNDNANQCFVKCPGWVALSQGLHLEKI